MIPRYSRAVMQAIWTDAHKFATMLRIELLVCRAQEKLGIVPLGSSAAIEYKAKIDLRRIAEIEAIVGHDVIAFVSSLSEVVGSDARYIHLGLTSSDVLDTCLAVQLRDACLMIESELELLLDVVKIRSLETKNLLCVGRTHGMHAEPLTFGMKFARFYAEFKRGLRRLRLAREEISVCSISGAVGAYNHMIPPFVEEYVADNLGLTVEAIASQIIPRDRHAVFFTTAAILAGSIENMAVEIRHLQRTEVSEVEEPFSATQKGSSAMPHKRNPILSENLTGLVRMIRSYAVPALENIALWHERDISHSSVERIAVPNVCMLLDFAISRLTHIIKNMKINDRAIADNLALSQGVMSSQNLLLLLVDKGMERDEAYRLVQRNAFAAKLGHISFVECALRDSDILDVADSDEIKEALSDSAMVPHYLDEIFDRVFCEPQKL